MKDIFRSAAFWKSSILSMTDNSFFELMRSVFGKIKTPFSKQQLINDLENFLSRDEIKSTISLYIDEIDEKIITAIVLLGEPTPEQLATFFFGEYSYAQLQDIIVNMEERFILYRFIEEKKPEVYHYGSNMYTRNNQADNKKNSARLALNPILKSTLLPFTKDVSSLFSMLSGDETAADGSGGGGSGGDSSAAQNNPVIFNDLIFASIFSFAANRDSFFRSENSNKSFIIRKRIIEEAKTSLTKIDMEHLVGSLLIMGLFYIDVEKLSPDKKRIDEFGLLTARERREYFTAALLVFLEATPNEILPPLYRNRIRELLNFIHSFVKIAVDFQKTALEDENTPNKNKPIFPVKTLIRIVEILKSQTGTNIITDTLIKNMEKAGLLIKSQTGFILNVNDENNTKNKNPAIALDSDFSILLYPEIEFNDAILIASFSDISETESSSMSPVTRFELEKDSVVRAYNNNITADKIIELLKRLSGKELNETLIWNLKDWEKRHGEVTLRKGVILNLSEEHRYLTNTRPFKALIKETLAPGLYFLEEDASDDAESALRIAGIDIIGQKKRERTEDDYISSSTNHFTKPTMLDTQSFKINFQSTPKPEKSASVSKKSRQKPASVEKSKYQIQLEEVYALTEKFHGLLEKTQLNETEKAELSARIDRKLILCETQLKESSLRYEKLEARHMDYAGKQNIAKQAIAQQSPVEIVRLSKGKEGKNTTVEEEKIYGIPKALEKEGTQLILVLDTENNTGKKQSGLDDELLRVPLAKISLLRRIKKSIFEI